MLPGWFDQVETAVLKATGAPGRAELTGELLRQWTSSEVWRLSYGLRSVIVKRSSDAQTGEAVAYERFVVPYDLPAPELFHLVRTDDAVLLVLADVGRVTLEQEPTAEGFLAAVELLARIRAAGPTAGRGDRAATPAGRGDPGSAHAAGRPRVESEFGPERLRDLADRLDVLDPGLRTRLTERVLPELDRLHREEPVGVVHGDFVPKNLVTDGTRWTAVDWPSAYLAPHLGDLYTLTREAVALGHQRADLVRHYCRTAGADPGSVEHQLLAGGCCFTLLALTWITEEGHRTVPQSTTWIPSLVAELDALTQRFPSA